MVMAAAEVKPLMTGQEMKSSRIPDGSRGNTELVPEGLGGHRLGEGVWVGRAHRPGWFGEQEGRARVQDPGVSSKYHGP